VSEEGIFTAHENIFKVPPNVKERMRLEKREGRLPRDKLREEFSEVRESTLDDRDCRKPIHLSNESLLPSPSPMPSTGKDYLVPPILSSMKSNPFVSEKRPSRCSRLTTEDSEKLLFFSFRSSAEMPHRTVKIRDLFSLRIQC